MGEPMGGGAVARMPLAFVDVETTGLDPFIHEIVEVAVLLEVEGEIVERYTSLVRPLRLDLVDPLAFKCNGFSTDPWTWIDALLLEDVVPELERLLDSAILVGHSVHFDRGFLQEAFRKVGSQRRLSHRGVDTTTLAWEHLVPLGLQSLSMDAIRAFLGFEKVQPHRAMRDAEDCRRVLKHCLGLRA